MTNNKKQIKLEFRAIEPCSGEYATGETFIGDGKGGIAIGNLNDKYFCEVQKETLEISLDGYNFYKTEEILESLELYGEYIRKGV